MLEANKYPYYVLQDGWEPSTSSKTDLFSVENIVREIVPFRKYEPKAHAEDNGFKSFDIVPSSHPISCNVINNVQPVTAEEKLLGEDGMPIFETQMPVSLLQELVCRFSEPGDTVVDFLAGAYSTGAACLTAPDGFRRFVKCESEEDTHIQRKRRLLLALAKEYIDGKLPASIIGDARAAAEKLLAVEENVGSTKSLNALPLAQQDGLPVYCKLSSHIMNFFAIFFGDAELFDRLSTIAVNEWPARYINSYRSFLITPKSKMFQVQDCMQYGVYVTPSTIPSGGEGVFAATNIVEGSTLGWYNGTIVYHELSADKYPADLIYGKQKLGCSGGRFRSCAMVIGLGEDEMDSGCLPADCSVPHVVPPPFCVGSKYNDYRKLATGYEGEKALRRKPNAKFSQSMSEVTMELLTDPFIVRVVAAQDIRVGEEIFVDYGKRYDFTQSV